MTLYTPSRPEGVPDETIVTAPRKAASASRIAVPLPSRPPSRSRGGSQSGPQHRLSEPSTPSRASARSRTLPTALPTALSYSYALGTVGAEAAKACTIAVSSPNGGVGTSVFAALLALALAQEGNRVALADATATHGGFDVLLGLEADTGMRWSDVEAPMGRLDPEALSHELLHWEGIDVLSADPWNGMAPQPWEVDAAFRALAEAEDYVIVDSPASPPAEPDRSTVALSPASLPAESGTGSGAYSPARSIAPLRVILVELSVLGLARARGFLASQAPDAPTLYIAVPPRRIRKSWKPTVSLAQASVYLDVDFEAVIEPVAQLEKDIGAGLGIRKIPKRYESILVQLCEKIGSMASDTAAPATMDGA